MLHTTYIIDFEKTKVTTKIPNYYNRMIRELVKLRNNYSTGNKDKAVDMLDIWLSVINMLKNSTRIATDKRQKNFGGSVLF